MKYREAKSAADASRRFVYMNDDGTTRELTPDEAEFLARPFEGFNSGRPYLKSRWRDRTPDGRLRGFVERPVSSALRSFVDGLVSGSDEDLANWQERGLLDAASPQRRKVIGVVVFSLVSSLAVMSLGAWIVMRPLIALEAADPHVTARSDAGSFSSGCSSSSGVAG